MSTLRHTARAAVVALAAAALAVGMAAPSQAVTQGQELSPQDEPQVTRLADGALQVSLPEPATAPASAASLAAPPDTSPATDGRYWTSEHAYLCDVGQVCFAVPYNGGYYIFKEASAGTYGMSNWFGTGSWIDNQTGSWSSSIHNADGSRRQCLQRAVDPSVYWTPVWSFQIRTFGC
ncbi:hypothetical protein [Promicromonospora panici]|uniref:hypothetical protein n=1 Tax=Promicromonospora panici TaxID=2219658 RepID=UPI00101D69FA|nr:hypothetical protein [Promicromonospora panici]